jgi:hypothetical protein
MGLAEWGDGQMTIQATVRSALILAAALCAVGVAGSSASYAATNSVFPNPPQVSTQASSDDAAAAPATTDANAAPTDQQEMAPVMPSPLAGNAVAENTDPAATTAASDATANTVSVSNDDSSGWDKASIIGKIFIACGTLLTLGSAARMFMI